MVRTQAHQPDLFAKLEREAAEEGQHLQGDGTPYPEDFIEPIRVRLNDMLTLVTNAARMPFKSQMNAMISEKHLHSMARYLPVEECKRLRAAFAAEMARLYEIGIEHLPPNDPVAYVPRPRPKSRATA